jgi:hypothetical protein
MDNLPLPARIHYEALLQLLEKKTLSISTQHSTELRRQVQELMFTIRKALSQQKQLENCCEQLNIPFEYHWSLHDQDEK